MKKICYIVIDNADWFEEDFFNDNAMGSISTLEKKSIDIADFKTVNRLSESLAQFNNSRIRLLWHLSSSGVSLNDLTEAIRKMKDDFPNAELRIGKSEHPDFRSIAERSGWFHLLGSGASLNTKFRTYGWNVDNLIKDLPSYEKQNRLNVIANEVLKFLLPLFLDTRKIRQFLLENHSAKASERLKRMSDESLEYYKTLESKINTFLNQVPKSDDELSNALAGLHENTPNLIKSLGLLGEPVTVTTDYIAKISNFHDIYEKICNELRKAE